MIPFQLSNLQDPIMQGFVNFIHHLTRAGNHQRPDEIHFLLHGLAGLGVDINAWGDRAHGLLGYFVATDLQNGTNLAERIYLVPVVEGHVVDGVAPHSLNYNTPPPNGPVSPFWYNPVHPLRNKSIQRLRLIDLVDRAAQLQQHFNHNRMLHVAAQQAGHPFVPLPLPAFNPVGMVGTVAQIDGILSGMYDEKAWRSGWTTAARAAILQLRNVNRNAPFM